MADYMELGNRNTKRLEGPDVEGRQGGGVGEAMREVYPPLTTDVIGNNDMLEPSLNVI